MAGELQNTIKYLNSLQAVTDIDYIFPSTQKTLAFSVEGLATDEWQATLEYSTLIVDQITYDRSELPIFDNSTVIGYYEGIGSATENTTGSITIPANMYTGKMLPASDRYVPITIVNIKWSNIATPTSTYSQNIAYIQQWEPGVIIGDPRDDVLFEPIEPIASTLTLTGVNRIVQGDTLVLVATSDIPIDIGTDNECTFFYFDGEEQVELGTALFDNTVNEATLSFVTDLLDLTTYEIFAEFGGRRDYGRTRSNGLSVEVLEGIPLLKESEAFVPSKAVYLVGDSVNYSIQVVPDPFFEPSGIEVANPVSFSTINSIPPGTSSTFFTGNFDDGAASGTFSVISSMVDTDLEFEGTVWSITTSTQNSTAYTATIFVQNTETVRVAWGYQTLGQYARGSTSTNIQVGTTVVRTVLADPFPITIDHNPPNSLQEEPFEISVATTFTSYENDITVVATNIADGTTSTLFTGNNSGTSTFVFPVSTLSTGTYTIVASYPGDIGNSIFTANQAAVSNQLTHVVRTGNELGAKFIFYNTGTVVRSDVLRVWATTSTTLTQTVSFFEGATLLGTATWSRSFLDTIEPITSILKAATSGTSISFADNFTADPEFSLDPNRNRIGYGWTSPNNDNNYDLTLRTEQYRIGFAPISDRLYNNSADLPSPILNNRYRLFKYYDGTNYDLAETASTNGSNIADPVLFNQDWNVNVRGYRTFNLNDRFMNDNTAFYNYVESRFGVAAMNEYLESLETLDGKPFALNNLIFNDRVIELPPEPIPPYPRLNPYLIGSFTRSTLEDGYVDYAPTEDDLSLLNLPVNFTLKKNDPRLLEIPNGARYYDPNSDLYINTKYNLGIAESYVNPYIGYSAGQSGAYYANDTIKYIISTKNVPDDTVFSYEQIGTITEDDLVTGEMQGTITVKNNVGFAEFRIDPSSQKIFRLRLRTSTGEIVGLETDLNTRYGRTLWNYPSEGYVVASPYHPQYPTRDLPMTVDKTEVTRGGTIRVTVRYPDDRSTIKRIYANEAGLSRFPIGPQWSYTTTAGTTYVGPRPDGLNWQAVFTLQLNVPTDRYWAGQALMDYPTDLQIHDANPRVIPAHVRLDPIVVPITPGAPQTVRQALYDVYRMDTIGDSRGYNVVGINANSGFVRPTVSESDPTRLYFMGANNKERYIDLVEYIGETEWDKPIENAKQKEPYTQYVPGTWPPVFETKTDPRSKIKVWLYRFTPTIPQANTQFRSEYEQTSIIDLIPTNNWMPRPLPGWPDDYVLNQSINRYGVDYFRDVNFPNAEYYAMFSPGGIDANIFNSRDDYYLYGRKVWTSANTSDPVENDKAAFYNDWYKTFTVPTSKVYTKDVFTTTYVTVTTDVLQNATLLLDSGTVIDPSALRSTWPGTRYLAPEFGRFNPFDLTLSSAYSNLVFDAYNVSVSNVATPTDVIYSTNRVLLRTDIISEPPGIASNTGTVQIFNEDTNFNFFTLPVVNNEPGILVNANSLTNLTSAPFLNLRSRYNIPLSSNFVILMPPPPRSNISRLQVVRSSYPYSGTFRTDPAITGRVCDTEYIRTKTYSPFFTSQIRLSGNINFTLPFFQGDDSTANSTMLIYLVFSSLATPTNIWYDRTVTNANGENFWRVIAPRAGTQPINYTIPLVNKLMHNFGQRTTQYRLSVRVVADNNMLNGSQVFVSHNLTDNIP